MKGVPLQSPPISRFNFKAMKEKYPGTASVELIPLSAGLVFVFMAGTSLPIETYEDRLLTIINTRPVILDSNGEANIYVRAKDFPLAVYIQNSEGETIRNYTLQNSGTFSEQFIYDKIIDPKNRYSRTSTRLRSLRRLVPVTYLPIFILCGRT